MKGVRVRKNKLHSKEKSRGTSDITNRTAEKPESYAEKYRERADSSKRAFFSLAGAEKEATASYVGGHTD